jgi:hypothetical protein
MCGGHVPRSPALQRVQAPIDLLKCLFGYSIINLPKELDLIYSKLACSTHWHEGGHGDI